MLTLICVAGLASAIATIAMSARCIQLNVWNNSPLWIFLIVASVLQAANFVLWLAVGA